MFDVSLSQTRQRLCNGTSRRDFVRVGGLGLFGLSLSGFLSAKARAAVAPEGSAEPLKARAKSLILVSLGGGLPHHDSFDMKPDQPEEIRGKYKPIDSNVTGLK